MTVTLYQNPNLYDFVQVCHLLPQDERDQYEAFTGMPYDANQVAASYSLQPGPSWVMVADGQPICIAGFSEIRSGVYQDWLFSTPVAWEKHWRVLTKTCKHVMTEMLRTKAHRLQCVSLASRTAAHRWYRPLGLVLEGTLHGYGVNGENALMFSRLRSPDG